MSITDTITQYLNEARKEDGEFKKRKSDIDKLLKDISKEMNKYNPKEPTWTDVETLGHLSKELNEFYTSLKSIKK